MAQNGWTEPATAGQPQPGSADDGDERPAEGLMRDVKDAAAEAGSHAKTLGVDKAEEVQGATAAHLRTFAEAVRSAGDELAEKQPGQVSALVRQAADGLERFSDVLGRRSPGEMLNDVRDFGRKSPMGFLAGSMLVGFSLARLATSAAPDGDESPAPRGRGPDADRGNPDRMPARAGFGGWDPVYGATDDLGADDAGRAASERQDRMPVERGGRTDG